MSTPSASGPVRVPVSETYKAKFLRKFKEQPLVPIGTRSHALFHSISDPTRSRTGAAATTVALTVAMVKMRQGKSKSFNNWLRVRIIAQGLTVVAIVGGSFALGQTKQQKELQAAQEQERQLALAAQERSEFGERMRAAEEAHGLEVQFSENRGKAGGGSGSGSGNGGKSWLKWGSKKEETGEKGVRGETAASAGSVTPVVPAPPPPNAGAKESSEGKTAGLWERLWWKKT